MATRGISRGGARRARRHRRARQSDRRAGRRRGRSPRVARASACWPGPSPRRRRQPRRSTRRFRSRDFAERPRRRRGALAPRSLSPVTERDALRAPPRAQSALSSASPARCVTSAGGVARALAAPRSSPRRSAPRCRPRPPRARRAPLARRLESPSASGSARGRCRRAAAELWRIRVPRGEPAAAARRGLDVSGGAASRDLQARKARDARAIGALALLQPAAPSRPAATSPARRRGNAEDAPIGFAAVDGRAAIVVERVAPGIAALSRRTARRSRRPTRRPWRRDSRCRTHCLPAPPTPRAATCASRPRRPGPAARASVAPAAGGTCAICSGSHSPRSTRRRAVSLSRARSAARRRRPAALADVERSTCRTGRARPASTGSAPSRSSNALLARLHRPASISSGRYDPRSTLRAAPSAPSHEPTSTRSARRAGRRSVADAATRGALALGAATDGTAKLHRAQHPRARGTPHRGGVARRPRLITPGHRAAATRLG